MVPSSTSVSIRSWKSGDEISVEELLAPDADFLWIDQFHSLHGPDLHDHAWRRTLIAIHNEKVVGAGTIAVNPVHPGRYSAVVEVHPFWRRMGIGSRLIDHLRQIRPQTIPFATKVHHSNTSALEFVRAIGGRTYEEVPGVMISPRDPAIAAWCVETPSSGEWGTITTLSHVPLDIIADAFAAQYLWVHQKWSPVGSLGRLRDLARSIAADVDGELSAGVWQYNEMIASVFAFREDDGRVEIVAETIRSDVVGGQKMLAAAIAKSMSACAIAGITEVVFDGHVSDPHLNPVLRTIPGVKCSPLYLVEIP